MKNKELINLLKTFNPNANVTTSIAEDITLSYITGGGQSCKYTKQNTPVIFIEPCDCLCCINYDICEEQDNGVCDQFMLEETA